jgi:hypothetical protein
MFASISNVVTAWATLAAACATVLLAFFTWRLARQAKAAIGQDALMLKAAQDQGEKIGEQAKATKAQADAVEAQAKAASEQLVLARQTLQRSVAPLLTIGEDRQEVPGGGKSGWLPAVHVSLTEERINARLEVLNIGEGLAIIRPGESRIVGWAWGHMNDSASAPDALMPYTSASVDRPILRLGEQVGLSFLIEHSRYPGTTTASILHAEVAYPQCFFDVVYGPNLDGADLTRARFHAVSDEAKQDWRVFEIDYFTPPEATEPWPSVRFH